MVYNILIKFVSDLRQVGGFLWFPLPIKQEILLKEALNTISSNLNLKNVYIRQCNFYLPKLHSALADFRSKYNRPIRCSVTNIYPQVLSIGQKLTFNVYIVGATGPAGEPGKEGPQGPTGNYWTLLNVYLFLALRWLYFQLPVRRYCMIFF